MIRGDDAVGLICTDRLRKKYRNSKNISFVSLHTAGISLVDSLAGYDSAVIVDAVKTEGGVPGAVYWADIQSLPDPRSDRSYHDIHISDALLLGNRMKMKMPVDVRILAVEVEDYDSWQEVVSPGALKGIETACREIENFLKLN